MPITPTWNEETVIASADLARGSVARGTLDLRSKHGAYLFARLGRGGTAALTNGVDVLIRRTLANDGAIHPGALVPLLSGTVAAVATTVSADSAAGQNALNVASIGAMVAGDIVHVHNGAGTREEWCRVSKVAAGVLTMDSPLKYTHTAAQADLVKNKADAFAPVWLMGGATYEVVVDYGDDSAGDTIRVEVKAQTYDNDLTA